MDMGRSFVSVRVWYRMVEYYSTTTRQASSNRRPNRKHSPQLRVLLPRQQLSGLPRIGGKSAARRRACPAAMDDLGNLYVVVRL
uniref:Uncharacterized protein n=1 Tax=Solanum tuberosum TaxID=4113 RepID=M1AJ76_SOLTU